MVDKKIYIDLYTKRILIASALIIILITGSSAVYIATHTHPEKLDFRSDTYQIIRKELNAIENLDYNKARAYLESINMDIKDFRQANKEYKNFLDSGKTLPDLPNSNVSGTGLSRSDIENIIESCRAGSRTNRIRC
jgi:hypothetical protein